MKNYDYKLARKIIDTFVKLTEVQSASLGMQEDWFWTGQTVWEDGEYKHALPENADELQEKFITARKAGLSIFLDKKNELGFHETNPEYQKLTTHHIAGLYSSDWATPVIQIDLQNGESHVFNCFVSDGAEADILEVISKMSMCSGGCLSGPVTEKRITMEIKDFNPPVE